MEWYLLIQDKRSIFQVLGCLIKEPDLFIKYDNIKLDRDDFPERFHKIIFAVISNLYEQGVEKLDALAIDSFLAKYKAQYEIFNENNGIEYVNQATEMAEIENFEYNAMRIKKYSLLRDLQKNGFQISEIYDENDEEKMIVFDKLTIDDIVEHYEIKLSDLKVKYSVGRKAIQAGEGLKQLKEQYKQKPEFGIPFPSPGMTRILRGFRKGKLYLHSSLSGRGKSRSMAGMATYQAVFLNKPILYITTEQKEDEIQTLAVAYISQVDEEKFLINTYNLEEEKRINEAIEKIENSPLYIEYVPDFTPEKIQNIIKHHKLIHNIEYVYFDYIKTTVEMLSELANKSRVSGLKEYNILYMFAEKLKRLANKLDIGIYTATQLNADTYDAKDDYNERLLRGAKAIADAIDVGIIIRELNKNDNILLEGKLETMEIPDLCFNIYKNRRGRKDISIYFKADHSTCHYDEILVLDEKGNKIQIPQIQIA
jgi:replicative DNA helicase